MWQSLTSPSVPYLELVIRAIVIYAFVLFLIRVSGKRQLGQLSAIEFVTILLISNAVQNAMNAGDNSLTGGMVLSSVLVFLSTGIAILSFRHKRFRHWVEGTPTILIRRGEVIKPHLEKEKLTHEELVTLLRRQGVHKIHEVELAILESDGSLSVTLNHHPT
ncbi:MAG: DUF421 domain-containing protein [Bdellovibrionales bacterium]|nr:DUF421 domain-containing protein [Bdellovibrionales bacterium]